MEEDHESNQIDISSSSESLNDLEFPLDNIDLINYVCSLIRHFPRRPKLPDFNTIEDVVNAISTSKSIMVVCGAGASVSCGIPDFRSKDGLYAKLRNDYPELASPTDMFSINFFTQNPKPFFKLCKDLFFANVVPGVAHHFVRALESQGKLLNCYTQNIDGLDKIAGVNNLVECHGALRESVCRSCGFRVDTEDLRPQIEDQMVPICSHCGIGVMKPDVVFFGEDLSPHFHQKIEEDAKECDLLIVIGSSLTVFPVSSIPRKLSNSVPQILVNRQRLPNFSFDVELLGDCDVILSHLALLLSGEFCGISSLRSIPELGDISEMGNSVSDDDVFYHQFPSRYFYRNVELDDDI